MLRTKSTFGRFLVFLTAVLPGCREPASAPSQETLRCEALESNGHTVGCGFVVGDTFVQPDDKTSWSVLEGIEDPEEVTPMSLVPLDPYEFVVELTSSQRLRGILIRAIRPDGREFSSRISD